jgi:POT family proton-dependent oligopeptide transporter
MPVQTPPAVASHARTFLGHPVGLGYLAFAEAWERFSFSGMQALLVLYLGQRLLLPGHVEHVAGFGAFRGWIEGAYGRHLSVGALASAIFGLYTGGVYLTPLFGGWLADRVLGRTRTITLGAFLLMAGHFLMAFEAPFLIALVCLGLGVGCFKSNIAAQVGELYAPNDLRRADAFQLYMIGISLAAMLSPLVCGALGQRVAWHWGFGAAGVGMMVGLAVYLRGRKWYPPMRREAGARGFQGAKLAKGEGLTILVLLLLLPPLALASVGNEQMFNAYLVWGEAHLNLRVFGQTMPVTWLVSADALIATGAMAATVLFWRGWTRRHREPDEIVKLVVGVAISATAPLVLALAAAGEGVSGRKIGLGWAILFHGINEIGVANVFPVGLALFARASPRAVGGVMVGVYYLNLFASNMLVGWLGTLYEGMTPTGFWLLHAALVGIGGALLLLAALVFRRILAPKVDVELAGGA